MRKKFVPTLSFLVVILSLMGSVISGQQKQAVAAGLEERTLFADSFESDLSSWELTISSPNTIALSEEEKHSGNKSLKLNYIDGNNNKYLEARHSFNFQTNIVLRGWFYDDLNQSKGVAFGLRDNSNGSHTLLGVNTAFFPNHYFIRHNSLSQMYNSGIERTRGWHLFEIIVTPQGTWAKIDNRFLGNWRNNQQTKADTVQIVATWNLTSVSFFDDISLLRANDNAWEEVLSLIEKHLYLYDNTDFSPLYNQLGLDYPVAHGNDVRAILDTILALTVDWRANNNQTSLSRAQVLLEDVVNYTHWPELNDWSEAIPTYRLIRNAALLWDFISETTKEKILIIAESKGNEFLNRWPISAYIGDTSAEDNAWNAGFLAAVSQFYDSHQNSKSWEDKGKCFAWHSVTTSTDPQFCGLKTQTVWDDFSLDNHNRHPNPVYTTSVIHLLAEGASVYRALGKPIPEEFKHNIAPLSGKLLQFIDESYHYQVNGTPFADWSGATDSFYNAPLALDFLYSENLGQSYPSWEELLQKRSLFYPGILSELTEKPLLILSEFDQSKRGSDGYQFFLNSNAAQILSLHYFWHHPQNSFRHLKWQTQESGISWQPFVWQGGPLINYETQNNQLVFSLKSQQSANAEVYSSLITVEPNKDYQVSYWVKTENLQSQGAQFPAAVIASEYNSLAQESDRLTDNRIHTGQRPNIPTFQGNNEWQLIDYKFTTTNQTKYVRLRALNAGWGTSTGKVWFKAIKLKKLPPIKTLLSGYNKNDNAESDLNSDGKINGIDFRKRI